MQYMAEIVDGALQKRLHSLPPQGFDLEKTVEPFVDDLIALTAMWRARFSTDELAGISYGDLLDAITVVCKTYSPKHKHLVAPSATREARQLIFKAETAEIFDFKRAGSLTSQMGYAGCQALMAYARDDASVGIQDSAAGEQFAPALCRLEEPLGAAFDDAEAFAKTANMGAWHTMSSMPVLLEVAKSSIVELAMLVRLWSAARLEEQQDAICDFLSCALLIVDLGGVFAARDFMTMFATASAGPSPTIAPVGAPDDGNNGAPPTDEPETNATNNTAEQDPAHQASNSVDSLSFGVGTPGVGVMASAMHATLVDFFVDLHRVLSSLTNVYAALIERLGQQFADALKSVADDPAEAFTTANTNKTLLLSLCKYLEAIASLSALPPLNFQSVTAVIETRFTCRTCRASASCTAP